MVILFYAFIGRTSQNSYYFSQFTVVKYCTFSSWPHLDTIYVTLLFFVISHFYKSKLSEKCSLLSSLASIHWHISLHLWLWAGLSMSSVFLNSCPVESIVFVKVNRLELWVVLGMKGKTFRIGSYNLSSLFVLLILSELNLLKAVVISVRSHKKNKQIC